VTDPAISGRPYTLSGITGAGVTMQGHITVAGQLVTLTQVVTVSASVTTGSSFAFNFSVFGISFSLENVSSVTLSAASMAGAVNGDTLTASATAAASSNMVLQIGANPNQVTTISLVDTRAAALGGSVGAYSSVEGLVTALTSANMQDLADELISMVDLAILDVNETRSDLGANQNRLGFTINNLAVGAENMAASESRIRDADIAFETVAFIKAQILQQAGTAVLAQANQAPQVVLALLR
jgi:flagellin